MIKKNQILSNIKSNFCIYILQSPTFKYYIGQTNNIKKRINSYRNVKQNTTNRKIEKSILKYGFENHSLQIIENLNEYELDFWEKFYIKLFDSFNTNHGLNLTDGGGRNYNIRFIPKSEEWKKKISISKKGKKRPAFSDEWRFKLSLASKSKIIDDKYRDSMRRSAKVRKERYENWFEQETKDKISATLKNYFLTEKGIENKLSLSKRCKNTFSKKVNQYNLDGIFLKEWSGVRDAGKFLKISHSDISKCANGKKNKAGGFIWKYQ